MSEARYYWCIRHSRVESGPDVCAARYTLGPYPTRQDAEHALEQVRLRNEQWDAEDAAWEGR